MTGSDGLKSACVLVRAPGALGTAYLVTPTRLATCHHVIESAGEGGTVELLLPERTVTARVKTAVKATDCAILEIAEPLPNREPLQLAGRCEGGAQWDGYGFPALTAGSGLAFFGIVLESESQDDLKRPMVTLYSDMLAAGMAAPVNGLSGGPVVIGGVAVGHFSRVLKTPGATGHPALGVVYASRAANVLQLLDQPPAVDTARAQPAATLSDLVPRLGPNEFHAFISYRSADRGFAVRLHERLEAVGFRVFLDQRELMPGDPVAAGLHDALARSRCGIVLVSSRWAESVWCREEANAMVSRAVNENGAFRVIPLRIEDIQMPGIFSGRLWVDFAGDEAPSGDKLDQVIYAVLGRPAPAAGSAEQKTQTTRTRATDEALRRVDEMVRDPTRFRRLVEFLRRTGLPEVAPRLHAAQALVDAGRPEAALEILPEPDVGSLRARQLRALALSKCGKHADARVLLEPLFERNEIDAETGGILGGIYKRQWNSTGDRTYLIKSLETYRVTYARTGDSYVGINVATMAVLAGRAAEGRPVAEAIIEDLGAKDVASLDHWERGTLAEAFLLCGDLERAAEWYEKAVAKADTRPQIVAVMRRQARLLLEKLGEDPKKLDQSLPVPPVVACSGHMTDAPGRAIPRFPESNVEGVRVRLGKWLRGKGGRVHAVCSAARGTDLLFLSEVLKKEGTATVFLPFPRDDFKKVSVGFGWDDLFDEVLKNERVDVRPPLLEEVPPSAELGAAFERCNTAILDEAERLAQLFDDHEPVLLTVWNGSPGDGKGGTAHAVAVWQQREHRTEKMSIS
jgi:tetratricopeptide (TPR) repeat protein